MPLVSSVFRAQSGLQPFRLVPGDENALKRSRRSKGSNRMTQRRRRYKQQLTLQDRLASWSKEVMKQAAKLPPGPERDALVKKAGQADLAVHVDDWLHSSDPTPVQSHG